MSAPHEALRVGFRDEHGRARHELRGVWAATAVESLRRAGVTASSLEAWVRAAAEGQHPAISSEPAAEFVRRCLEATRAPEDLGPCLEHLRVVLHLLALVEGQPRRT
jgi:transposase-like protein